MSDDTFSSKKVNNLTAGEVLRSLDKNIPPSETSKPERAFKRKTEEKAVWVQMQYEHLKGIRDHYQHKGNWSRFLMLAVGVMLLFQFVLLVAVGLGHLDFSQYEWLLPALLVQNLGQVVGLAVYAVKYLFSDISTQGKR